MEPLCKLPAIFWWFRCECWGLLITIRQPIAGDIDWRKFTQAVSKIYSRFIQAYPSSCF